MTRMLILLVAIIASGNALADRWISYTDGRAGGCWLNNAGVLYGCTPQQNPSQSRDDSAQYPQRQRPSVRERELEVENSQLRAQQDADYRKAQAVRARQEAEARAIREYYEEQNKQQSIREAKEREWQWHADRRCDSEEYDLALKEKGLKRRPYVQGICVKLDWEPGSSDIGQSCPPCN